MSSFDVRWIGKDLARIAVDLEPALRSQLVPITEDVADGVRAHVKRRTGRTAESTLPKPGEVPVVVQSGDELRTQVTIGYGGPFLETGTTRMAAQPFADVAIDEAIDGAQARLAAAVEETFNGE